MKNRILCIFAVLLCVVSLTGCYDNNEIDTLATVMAVGIGEGDSKEEREYTFAVSDTESFGSDQSGDASSLICYSQRAKSLEDAKTMVDRKISKKLSFSHISAIFVSKKCAFSDMASHIKFFEEDHTVRPQVMIAITDIEPKKYLESLRPELEANPEKYFQSVFRRSVSFVPAMRLSDYSNALRCKTTVLAPVIWANPKSDKLTEEDAFIASSALISKGRFVREIKDNSFLPLFFSHKKVKSQDVTLRSIKKPKVVVNLKDSFPVAEVMLCVKTDNKDIAEKIEKDAQGFLDSCYREGLDVINLRSHLKKKFLRQEEYEKANEIIKNIRFNVKIQVAEEGEV